MELNIHNVEELVFYDRNCQRLVPEFRHLFDQWKLAKYSPALRPIGKQAMHDFLDNLTSDHLSVLGEYFGDVVTKFNLDCHIVRNYTFDLSEAEEKLNSLDGYANFSTSRMGDRVYICFWR